MIKPAVLSAVNMSGTSAHIAGLKQLIEKLEQSEEKYRNLYDNSLVAMFTSDAETLRITAVNELGVQLFGYRSKEDFLDNFKPLSHFVNPEARAGNIETVRTDGEVRSREQQMKKLDGTLFWAKIFIKVNQEKSVAQTVVIDISEQKRLQDEKKEYTKSLEEILFMTSHKLRKPVTNCLGLIHLVEGNRQLSQAEIVKILAHFEASILELDAFTRELTTSIFEMKEKSREEDWD